MKFIKGLPSKDGYYWLCTEGGNLVEMANVGFWKSPKIGYCLTQMTKPALLEDSNFTHYCGPIVEPKHISIF